MSRYAENNVWVSGAVLPLFVTVAHARPPVAVELAAEVAALTTTVAQFIGRPAERVPVPYAPPALAGKHLRAAC